MFVIYRRYHLSPALIGSIFSILALMFLPTPGTADSARVADDEIVIVVLGDSLTAGYGVASDVAFPVRLELALREKGYKVRVHNAGVSGDTAADALARLDWAVTDDADAVIVELGANDALRGFSPERTEKTLDDILKSLKGRGLPVLLTGMEAPRNYGPDYAKKFAGMYARLAKRHEVLLYPFFLEGVALDSKLNQPDGIHPNAEGVAVIVRNILPSVEKLIEQVRSRRAGAS